MVYYEVIRAVVDGVVRAVVNGVVKSIPHVCGVDPVKCNNSSSDLPHSPHKWG